MLNTGDWLSVRYNGHLNFEYPPMFIWFEALSMKVLGISDFAAKFPSALSALLIILLVFMLTLELSGEFLPALCASWILTLSQYFMKWSMHAMTDAPFTFFFILSLYLYVKGLKRPNYLILCGPVIGAAILTRSVIGLIPIGIIASHLIITRQHRKFLSIRLLVGLSIAMLLPFTWYFSQYLMHGDQFLSGHLSFVGGKIGVSSDWNVRMFALGILKYPLWLLQFYWPWLPFMVYGLVFQVKRAVRDRESSAVLLVVWVVLVVVPFSFAKFKVLRYIMPAFPAFAILAAFPIAKLISQMSRNIYRRTAYAALIAVVIIIGYFPNPRMRAEDMIKLGPTIDAHTDPAGRVMIYTSNPEHINYIPQLLWYSNRFCVHLTEPDKLSEALRTEVNRVFIMLADDYTQSVINSGRKVELLMRTKHLVCFRTLPDMQL